MRPCTVARGWCRTRSLTPRQAAAADGGGEEGEIVQARAQAAACYDVDSNFGNRNVVI